MIKINTKIDTPFFEQLKTVSTVNGKKDMSMAINDALRAGITTEKREVSLRYNLKQKEIVENTKLQRATFSNLKNGKITVSSRRLTVGTSTHFSITPREYTSQKGIKSTKRKTATATIRKKGKEKVKHAFIANPASIKGGNTMLWIKLNNNGGIAPLKTISIPQMVSNPEVYKPMQKNMQEKYLERFEHYRNRTLERMKGK
ncbi:phage tail protein [Anaerocolumna chitinilytica]|uniref:Uncharacterized protein n=1 Tax=Anaerocolumna chitinilytica TaxID=1727145 RepID=A0A7I8DHY1_9FIRM|nr:phage tail protein [Anaerocolumna chitinilytica]BCJ98108.1 hypothetical protein bsdcttw_11490 [Anaerocolumna chitinilytica]